jgi:hypothetical protein
LLQVLTEPAQLESASLQSINTTFLRHLQRIDKEISSFAQSVVPAKAMLGPSADDLLQTTSKLKALLARMNEATDNLKREWERHEAAIRYLTMNELPPVTIGSIQESEIRNAVQAVRARQPDDKLAPLISHIADGALREAIQQANDNIAIVEDASKPVALSLEQLHHLVENLGSCAPALARSAKELSAALTETVSQDEKALVSLRNSATALVNSTEALKASAAEFRKNFIVAEDSYTARRYEREARANEDAAALYEVQVRKSDLSSDGHRRRSKLFFYGMLAAQAGVTISAFSLALKHRSFLWSLATCAGLGAVLFGAYVYIYM